ncbi:LacI family DNA-binding transcriptional regulator [Plantibacter sp. Mn2098]|uniref:LacI family DNA-binding transcriptional regulator n=1 Tax=Plantibacter sp. Mn2098 TaxID=3395266 RepID=UPI003BC347F9
MELDNDAGTRRPVTLSDVAKRAGVSQSTASRVVNGSARKVDDKYRVLVMQAAQELGYTPNLAAQAVARGASHTIALIVGGIADPYFSAMTAAIMAAAEAVGLRVSVAVSGRRADRELELVRELRGQQPRAIILAGSGYIDAPSGSEVEDELRRYEETGGRVVLISRADMPFETVAFDNFDGGRALAVQLAGLGYRRPLVLASDIPLLAMQQRVDGFVAGFEASGVPVAADRVVRPKFTWAGTYALIEGLSDEALADVDVVFAVTDEGALGALAALRARGVGVPERIGVAGFDDVTTLRDVVPSLTTVHVPLDEVATEAIARAIAPLEDVVRRVVPTSPILRDSTPPQ